MGVVSGFRRFRHAFVVGWICFFVFSVNSHLDYSGGLLNSDAGFGVLNTDTLVVGTSKSISLVHDGIAFHTFAIRPLRSYVIGTSGDGSIQIYSVSGDIFTYDASGAEVRTKHDETGILYGIRYRNRKTDIENETGIFHMDRSWGYARIVLDNGSSRKIIYEEPIVSYISKVSTMAFAIYMALVVSLTLIRYARDSMRLHKPKTEDRREHP